MKGGIKCKIRPLREGQAGGAGGEASAPTQPEDHGRGLCHKGTLLREAAGADGQPAEAAGAGAQGHALL